MKKAKKGPTHNPGPNSDDVEKAHDATSARIGSRAETLIELLRRPEGATIQNMTDATGWLPHSVRGFLAGALKKRHRLSTSSELRDNGRVYQLVEASRE